MSQKFDYTIFLSTIIKYPRVNTNIPLGKPTEYPLNYDPDLLCVIPRQTARQALGIDTALPFKGTDIWNAYELSWLDSHGKPQITIAQFWFPCDTLYIIESKSFKLYLNGLNQKTFQQADDVLTLIQQDLSDKVNAPVIVKFHSPQYISQQGFSQLNAQCLDHLNLDISCYTRNPNLLTIHAQNVQESLYSDLFRSNCPITNQPDWASILITYQGDQIDHVGLLKYIISYRNEQDFHEHCVEQMYVDIMQQCKPNQLSVYACFLRRGGLDINPFRSNILTKPDHLRLSRQ